MHSTRMRTCVPSTAVAVSPGGSTSVHAGTPTPPPEQTPPGPGTPSGQDTPHTRHPQPGPGTSPHWDQAPRTVDRHTPVKT